MNVLRGHFIATHSSLFGFWLVGFIFQIVVFDFILSFWAV